MRPCWGRQGCRERGAGVPGRWSMSRISGGTLGATNCWTSTERWEPTPLRRRSARSSFTPGGWSSSWRADRSVERRHGGVGGSEGGDDTRGRGGYGTPCEACVTALCLCQQGSAEIKGSAEKHVNVPVPEDGLDRSDRGPLALVRPALALLLLAREAGAVDWGLENLGWCLFFGIPPLVREGDGRAGRGLRCEPRSRHENV